jgi:hypothetical protein
VSRTTSLFHHAGTGDQVVNAPLVIPEDKEHVNEPVERYHSEQEVNPGAHHYVAPKTSIFARFRTNYSDIYNFLANGLPVSGQQRDLDYRNY